MEKTVSYLILDYERPEELYLCLTTIKKFNQIEDSDVIVLANGGSEQYQDTVFQFRKDGLIDDLILKKENNGGGNGMNDLFKYCSSPYAIFVESDQYLNQDFTQDMFDFCNGLLENGYGCVDLAGNQCQGSYSNRANIMKTDFYHSMKPFPGGGPGTHNEKIYNENHIQNYFKNNKIPIYFQFPTIFSDNGKWSVREYPAPCNGISKHRTDTKALYWIKKPEAKFIFPNLTDEEWAISIAGKWIDGTIPEMDRAASFKCFGD